MVKTRYSYENMNIRKKAKNDFEKYFFKLMNNAVFGKTCSFWKNISKFKKT